MLQFVTKKYIWRQTLQKFVFLFIVINSLSTDNYDWNKEMVRITGIGQIGSFGSSGNLFTRRDQVDNSEMYINSKLSALYQRAIADCFVSTKLNSIKKFTDGNKIDKMV